ncbi:hypothetical protein [Dactylosporangium sp. NPDC005555]|uniref:hypothetical protein n=1 Tax=Dactylosporangium sp. NPDC005555 TaxID=3154889 RepID=UPI0033AF5075
MGVMMDYFAATAQELAALDFDAGPAGNDWPYVDCKGWILEVEEFAAEIDGRDPSEFGRDEPLGGIPDAEFLGPWTARINAELVDTLARIGDGQIRDYADEYLLEAWEAERLVALAGLARSAVTEGRALYSWSSV